MSSVLTYLQTDMLKSNQQNLELLAEAVQAVASFSFFRVDLLMSASFGRLIEGHALSADPGRIALTGLGEGGYTGRS